jgi:hypothetical protein
MQLELPIPGVGRIPILSVEMDGTGLPVVRKECEGRAGKRDGQPAHTREAKLGCNALCILMWSRIAWSQQILNPG